jgi:hypothetical protein
MTTRGRKYPTRIDCTFQGKAGQIVLDQIRTLDKVRLIKRLGRIDKRTQENVIRCLGELFALAAGPSQPCTRATARSARSRSCPGSPHNPGCDPSWVITPSGTSRSRWIPAVGRESGRPRSQPSSCQRTRSVIAVGVWSATGWHAVLYLAYLQSIPADYYEVATIDGASPRRGRISVDADITPVPCGTPLATMRADDFGQHVAWLTPLVSPPPMEARARRGIRATPVTGIWPKRPENRRAFQDPPYWNSGGSPFPAQARWTALASSASASADA